MHLLCPELDEKLRMSYRKRKQAPLKLGTNNGTSTEYLNGKIESMKDISPTRPKQSMESLEYIDEGNSN